MTTLIDLSRVDMNDPTNLHLYSEILVFKDDLLRQELVFRDRANSEQRILQALAHRLGLEYEYFAQLKIVRISRPANESLYAPGPQNYDLVNMNWLLSSQDESCQDEDFNFLDFDLEQNQKFFGSNSHNFSLPPVIPSSDGEAYELETRTQTPTARTTLLKLWTDHLGKSDIIACFQTPIKRAGCWLHKLLKLSGTTSR
ncbi:hypothetical protein ONS95_014588 [Cadophora gregata]|uniref:uncharacterized protein n=1 Tax=Cadophora gregata TaxID=51156 RepID=UPI0026DDBE02|nr:uncharacterized protein ONS95_014588 [Cadophora gregata]KAK0112864.1 hypothetical protein ONS95_014588 [Cadophora gregata]KAK0124992.1 hypothetical protein ONS96_008862 [Cadophora gregata f. sp. sojae]